MDKNADLDKAVSNITRWGGIPANDVKLSEESLDKLRKILKEGSKDGGKITLYYEEEIKDSKTQ